MIDTDIIAEFEKPVKIGNTEHKNLKGKVLDSVLVSDRMYYGSETKYLVKFTLDEDGKELKEPYITLIKPNQITTIFTW